MAWIYLLSAADALVGLAVAVIAWVAYRREQVRLRLALRVQTLIVTATALGFMVLFSAWSAFPFWSPSLFFPSDSWLWVHAIDFNSPIALAIVMVVVLSWPAPRPAVRGVADLAPRGISTFARPRWLGGFGALVVAVILIAVMAGAASQPDEEGRYVSYRVEVGTMAFGSSIYGWFFSIPCLAIVLLLTIAAVAALALIARPTLGPDREHHVRVRRLRARNVLAVASGGLLLHVGAVLGSLGATASVVGGFTAGTVGTVSVGTPFAALGPTLTGGGFIAACLGYVLWWLVLLSVVPLRTRSTRRASA